MRIGVRYLRRPGISNTHPKYPQIENAQRAQWVNAALLCTKVKIQNITYALQPQLALEPTVPGTFGAFDWVFWRILP